MKVFVEGPNSEKNNIITITKELELFIKNELQNLVPPSEKLQSKLKKDQQD
jgi:hypothetical protein